MKSTQKYDLEKRFNRIVFILLTALILWGCALNSKGVKYSKVYLKENLPKPFKNCFSQNSNGFKNSLLVGLNLPDSYMCCNSSRKDDLLCVSSNDKIVKWLSSSWAWIIPFFPLLLTLFAEGLEYCFPSIFHTYPPPAALANRQNNDENKEFINPLFALLKENNTHRFYSILLKALFRALCYFLIILARAYLLYLGPLKIVEYLVDHSWIDNSSKCWCPELVSHKKCQLTFDYSDHVVLCVVQYIFPTLLEINYLLYNKLISSPQPINPSSNTIVNANTSYYFSLQRSFNWRSIYIIPFLYCLAFIFINFRLLFFTTLFFHTPLENIVGFIIAYAFSFFWLFSSKGLMFWLTVTNS